MEGTKPVGSSSSSFTSELFGSKESSSASSGIFGAMFSPSSKDLVFGRESLRSEATGKKFTDEALDFKSGDQGGESNGSEGESRKSMTNKDIISSIYKDQRVQPCHLSSSIYYGGQDVYSHPQSTQTPGYNSVYKKDGNEDDGSASRGNWWQGSLYY